MVDRARNHSYSHFDLHTTALDTFKKDVFAARRQQRVVGRGPARPIIPTSVSFTRTRCGDARELRDVPKRTRLYRRAVTIETRLQVRPDGVRARGTTREQGRVVEAYIAYIPRSLLLRAASLDSSAASSRQVMLLQANAPSCRTSLRWREC